MPVVTLRPGGHLPAASGASDRLTTILPVHFPRLPGALDKGNLPVERGLPGFHPRRCVHSPPPAREEMSASRLHRGSRTATLRSSSDGAHAPATLAADGDLVLEKVRREE